MDKQECLLTIISWLSNSVKNPTKNWNVETNSVIPESFDSAWMSGLLEADCELVGFFRLLFKGRVCVPENMENINHKKYTLNINRIIILLGI